MNRAEKRRDSRADTGEKIVIAPPMGSMASPAASSERPKPYPVAVLACRIWVVTRNPANIANPISTDATFVHSTAGRAETRRSTSG